MGQGRHAAPNATVHKVRRAAAVVLAAGALVSTGGTSAFADGLGTIPLSGQANTDQDGEQNLNCGNSAHLIRLNVAKTTHREKDCVDTDGHTHRHSRHLDGAQAVGGTVLGPQVNTAQTGKQNLNCGNSADLITVNVAGTINEETTCAAVDRGDGQDHGHGGYVGGSKALGGTSAGQQVNTAQTGKQNLNCGNSSNTVTLNVLGTIRKHTTCIAADHSHGSGPAAVHRGPASADAGQVVGIEKNTAQNGRQNQACGHRGDGIDLPLGQIKRETRCIVQDNSASDSGGPVPL
ncbi:hypothetical protein AB0D13_01090 [Streptomyces sp. NPDC048430]|uniref:hypothetical protein n=1 Tax=Streptomyces sp. NPDC048430 TaxID=3155388 RepID=UPI003413A0D1